MTLDEAIEHAEQTARSCDGECSEDHRQLSEWLQELKKHRAVRAVQDLAIANMRAVVLESEQLKSENASLRGAAMGLGELCDQLKTENKRLKRKLEILKAHGVEIVDAVSGGFEVYSEDYKRADALKGENARYRELVEILRRDWHIEASWDGLRKFWYVGLTEEGVRERDERDAKLRELIRAMWFLLCVTGNDDLVAEVGKNGETIWTVDATAIAEKMHELGFEVE